MSGVNCRGSIVGGQLSGVDCRGSIVGGQLSGVNCRGSIVGGQLSGVIVGWSIVALLLGLIPPGGGHRRVLYLRVVAFQIAN